MPDDNEVQLPDGVIARLQPLYDDRLYFYYGPHDLGHIEIDPYRRFLVIYGPLNQHELAFRDFDDAYHWCVLHTTDLLQASGFEPEEVQL